MIKTNHISLIVLAVLFQFGLTSCSKEEGKEALAELNAISNAKAKFLDPNTPTNVQPNISTTGKNTIPAFETKYHIWELVFSDEFNDTQIESTKWNANLTDRGWKDGIRTWQSPENVWEDGNSLVLRYKKDAAAKNYSSGRIDTKDKFEMAYGYWECSMRIAYPNGYQTAFWMMPPNGTSPNSVFDGTANDGAEIDIVEGNKQGNQYSTGLHWDGYGANHKSNGSLVSAPFLHNGQKHIYGVEWSPTFIKFYFNGVLKRTLTNTDQMIHVKEYGILSGGIFAGTWTDGDLFTAPLPDYAYIDYIRVYKSKQMDYGTGYFKINNTYTNKSLTVTNGTIYFGAEILQATDNETDNQLFQIIHQGSGLYAIVNKQSGKCVMQTPFGYLAQQTYTGATNQKWRITPLAGSNQVYIQNASNLGFIEIEGESMLDDARIKVTGQERTSCFWEILHPIN